MQTNQQEAMKLERLSVNDNPASFFYGVHSIFYTIQGEGPYAGTPAIFIRLAGCNLQCPFCDTQYSSTQRLLTAEIIKRVLDLRANTRLVVISGGEPFRQPIGHLCQELMLAGCKVQIETNGTLHQPGPWQHVTIVCSPKSGVVSHKLQPFIDCYKYVAAAKDLNHDDGLPDFALGHPASPRLARPHAGFTGRVYLQALDVQDETENLRNLDAVVEACLLHGHNLCIQTHKLIGVP